MSLKTKTALISIAVPLALTLTKIVVGILTMSMAILASALDSFMDAFSSTITMVAIRTAEKPADESHPFGHGKAEAIAGLVQAILIAMSAAFLIYQAFHRVVSGYRLESETVGIVVMAVALIISILLARRLAYVGARTESTAIKASALNFGADAWTNAGVLVALGLERWAHMKNADPIISILISLYIIVTTVRICRDSITQLMDKTLPKEILTIIDDCIRSHGDGVSGYHNLRTRSVGGEKEIEFHVEIDSSLSFQSAHEITEEIIADIEKSIPNSRVTVHSDPA